MQKIKVAIYEDQDPLRHALEGLLRSAEDMILVGSYNQCLSAVEQTLLLQPEVILMDIGLPKMSGIEAVRALKKAKVKSEIIILTIFEDDDNVFDAIKAGAIGYLLKSTGPNKILESIRQAKIGGVPITPDIAKRILKSFSPKPNTEVDSLSDREYEMLSYLAKGYSYKMVATEMKVSLETIRTYVKRSYSKLHVHSLIEAINKVFTNQNG
jgi:DNA-binding NarL/FixJ family response regulator